MPLAGESRDEPSSCQDTETVTLGAALKAAAGRQKQDEEETTREKEEEQEQEPAASGGEDRNATHTY